MKSREAGVVAERQIGLLSVPIPWFVCIPEIDPADPPICMLLGLREQEPKFLDS